MHKSLIRFGLFCLSVSLVTAWTACSLSVQAELAALDEAPEAPVGTASESCRPRGQFTLAGDRAENTRIIAIVEPTGGDVFEVEVAALEASPTFTGTLTLTEDGTYSVRLVAENGLLVRSSPTPAVEVRVDSVVPNAPLGILPTQAVAGFDVSIDFTTSADAIGLQCTADPVGPENDVAGSVGDPGFFTVALPIKVGANAFRCTAVDTCGNRSPPTLLAISGGQDVVGAPVVILPPVNARLVTGVTTARVTASGTTEADTTVEMTINGGLPTVLEVGLDPLAWEFSVDLAAGIYAIGLVAVRNGVRSATTVANVTVATLPPAPTTTCAPSPTNASSLSMTGRRVSNTAVQIIVDDGAPALLVAAAASTSWSVILDISAYGDGALRYALQSVDAIGLGDVGVACDLVIDRSAPAAPVLDPLEAVIPFGESSGVIEVTGTGEIGASVLASVDGGATTQRTTVDSDGAFSFLLTLALAGNPHNLSVKLADGARNESTATTVTLTVRSGLVRPALTIPSNGTFPLITAAIQVALSGTRPDTAGVLARFDDGAADFILVANNTAGSTFTADINVPSNASIGFCLYAFDADGESDARCLNSGDSYVITNDTIAPADPVVTLPATTPTATVSATVIKDASSSVAVSINGGAFVTRVSATNTLTSVVVANIALAQGANRICFQSVDIAGNESGIVCADTVGPLLAAPTTTCAPSPTNAASLALAGTRVSNTAIQITVDDEAPALLAAAGSSTSWSASFDISQRSEGALSYSLQCVDAVGGGDVSVACGLVIDRTAPVAPVIDPVVPVIALGLTAGTVVFTGTGEVGASVLASVDGGGVAQTTIVDGSGTFRFSLVLALAGNPHSVSLKLSDAAGNQSAATLVLVTVRNALVRPELSAPANDAFPLFTAAFQVALTGTRPATAGVLARFDDGTSDVILVPNTTAGSTFTADITLASNASIGFCLYAFDEDGESDARCLNAGGSYVITNDSIAPADPVVTLPGTTQRDTVSATVIKDPSSSVAVSINDGAFVTRVLASNTQTSVLIDNLALAEGFNQLCFQSVDVAGNESGIVCADITLTSPVLTLAAPSEQEIVNENLLFVDASLSETTATSFTICLTTGLDPAVCLPAVTGSALQETVDIGPPPEAATLVSVQVCGTDGIVTACQDRNIVRWGQPEQVSGGSDAKNPAVAVDPLGRVHLVWQDAQVACTTSHLDVVTQVRRVVGTNRVRVSVSRPTELGLAVGASFTLLGTVSYNGNYTVRTVTNGVVESVQTVAVGATETAGNLLTSALNPGCRGPDILYARLDDNGWSETLNLSDVGGDEASTVPAIVTDDVGNLHVAWQEAGNLDPINGSARAPVSPADGDKTDIVHRVIDGETGAISLPLVISRQDDNAHVDDKNPSLATRGGAVVAAWETLVNTNTRQVLVSRFNASTTPPTWSAAPAVAFALQTGTAPSPSVGLGASGTAFVAWVENSGRTIAGGTVGQSGDRDIVLCALAPADASCIAPLLVSTGTDTGTSSEPAIAVAGNGAAESVHVVWSDTAGRAQGTINVLHKRLQLNGAVPIIGPTTSVSTPGNSLQNPTVAAAPDSTEIVVLWIDNTPNLSHSEFTMFSSVGIDRDSDNDGVDDACTFDAPALVIDAEGNFSHSTKDSVPTLALSEQGGIFVACAHQPPGTNPPAEIFAFGFQY